MKRRAFLTTAAAVGAAATFTHEGAAAPLKKTAAALRLSCQEWVVSGSSLKEKVAKLARWEIEGLEVGGKGLAGKVTEIKNALRGSGVKVSAICAGFDGALGHHDPAERTKAITSMKAILEPAGELESTGLIFVPAFNHHQSKLSAWEVRTVLLDVLPELGDVAKKAGTRVILEPLNRKETIYVRLLADAAAIVRDVDHPAVAMMGDFYHMGIEETSDLGAFLSAGPYLRHVHLATTKGRLLPGQAERSYVEGFRGLKMLGYREYCSFECGVRGDRDVEIPKSVAFLKNEWEKAKV
jgi:sugar phosphate isomerase/epimerase